MGKFFVQRSSPFVIAVAWTLIKCSDEFGFGTGTGSVVRVTSMEFLSGWRIAFWV